MGEQIFIFHRLLFNPFITVKKILTVLIGDISF